MYVVGSDSYTRGKGNHVILDARVARGAREPREAREARQPRGTPGACGK